jgi:hypothetical protein
MDGMAEPILLTAPSRNSVQVYPNLEATKAATPDESINIIWLEPERPSSPKMYTFVESVTIRKRMGIMANIKDGFL